ncbi:MAG TPA: cytochrome C oxidase subunit IV family protein [Chitinophagaceae bacterium]|nr:cytochrome C oxidase subunit IV family protein [Chitinophagaceae bacterium]
MEHTTTIHTEHHDSGTKEIWRTFWILLFLTIVELVLGFLMIGMESKGLIHTIKGAIIILMLAKAFYIVAYFMHLKHEIRNLIMTIIVPLLLFVWFITAFLADGDSYRNLRNTYDPYHKEQSAHPAPKMHGHGRHGEDAVKPGEKE